VRPVEKGLWISLSGLLVVFSLAFTVFEAVRYHLCSTAALGTETAQNCSPSGSRGAVVIGLVLLAVSSAILFATIAVVRKRLPPY
jgi:hypothetical protein